MSQSVPKHWWVQVWSETEWVCWSVSKSGWHSSETFNCIREKSCADVLQLRGETSLALSLSPLQLEARRELIIIHCIQTLIRLISMEWPRPILTYGYVMQIWPQFPAPEVRASKTWDVREKSDIIPWQAYITPEFVSGLILLQRSSAALIGNKAEFASYGPRF